MLILGINAKMVRKWGSRSDKYAYERQEIEIKLFGVSPRRLNSFVQSEKDFPDILAEPGFLRFGLREIPCATRPPSCANFLAISGDFSEFSHLTL